MAITVMDSANYSVMRLVRAAPLPDRAMANWRPLSARESRAFQTTTPIADSTPLPPVRYCSGMSSRSRIRVPAKKPRSWAVTLIRNRGVLLGYVEAPDQKAAELVAAKAFMLNEWQRKRLLVRERI
jgi:hypothetical protein